MFYTIRLRNPKIFHIDQRKRHNTSEIRIYDKYRERMFKSLRVTLEVNIEYKPRLVVCVSNLYQETYNGLWELRLIHC